MSESKVCPECQNGAPEGARRCEHCGHTFEAAQQAGDSDTSSGSMPKTESGDKIPIGKVSGQIPVFSPMGQDSSKDKKGTSQDRNESSGLTEMSATVPAENDASRPGSYVFVDKSAAERKKQRRGGSEEPENEPDPEDSSQGSGEKRQSDAPVSVADILPDKTGRVVAESTAELLFGDGDLPSYHGKNKALSKLTGIARPIKRLFHRVKGAKKTENAKDRETLVKRVVGLGGRSLLPRTFLEGLEPRSSLAVLGRIAKGLVLWHVVAAGILLIAMIILFG